MKLLPILFESIGEQFPPEKFGCVFGLDSGGAKVFVLFSLPAFSMHLKKNQGKPPDPNNYVVGYVSVKPNPKNVCLGTAEVAAVASNPKYKGVGPVMYALASKALNVPLTSDRQTSTSNAGKTIWRRIETSGEFQQTAWLDNYKETDEEPQYVDINGPNSFSPRKSPRTPEKEDDCPIPRSFDDSLESSVDLLGTGYAYRYTGSLEPSVYLQSALETFRKLSNLFGFSPAAFKDMVVEAGLELFYERYNPD